MRRPRHQLAWTLLFVAAAGTACARLVLMGRGLTFFYDEWDIVQAQRQPLATAVFTPHNGHPSMVPVLVYRLLFAVVGLRHYGPYRVVLAVVIGICASMLYLLLCRRLHRGVAVVVAGSVVLMGPAWQDLFWPFQIGYMMSVAGGLAALVALDRPSPPGYVVAATCLSVAVASSGVGLPFLAAAAVELAWRRSWRLLWVPGIPFGLFLVWYLLEDRSNATTSFHLGAALPYLGRAAATTVGAVLGMGETYGGVVAAAVAALCLLALVLRPGRCARLAGVVVGVLSFWGLTFITRGTETGIQSRYILPGGLLLVLVAAEAVWAALSPVRRPAHRPSRASRAVEGRLRFPVTALGVVAAAGLAALVVWSNSAPLAQGRDFLFGVSQFVRAELGAVELGGATLPPGMQPDPHLMPQVTVGPYLSAVRHLGSPADPPGTLMQIPEPYRAAADAVLLRGLHLLLPVAVGGWSPTACSRLATTTPTDISLTLPPTGLVVRAPRSGSVTISVKGLAATYPSRPLAVLAPASAARLVAPPLSTHVPWELQLGGPGGPQATCSPIKEG